jgi:hypothetical protein
MADTFVYRADPPAALATVGDLAALARLQAGAGLDLVTPGSPVTADEIRRGPHEATQRLSAELAAVRAAVAAPVKLCLPLPGLANLDPMLLQGLIGNLIDEGARVLQLDGAGYCRPRQRSGQRWLHPDRPAAARRVPAGRGHGRACRLDAWAHRRGVG